jgi:hypothetical protein
VSKKSSSIWNGTTDDRQSSVDQAHDDVTKNWAGPCNLSKVVHTYSVERGWRGANEHTPFTENSTVVRTQHHCAQHGSSRIL